jgi:tetracycline resistance efflux pump
MLEYGALALIPPLVVIVLAVLLRSSFEPLLIGCMIGFIMIGYFTHTNFFNGFVDSLIKILSDKDSVWVILVCGLYGSLIGLMVRSGGTARFGDLALNRIKTKKNALITTWLLGLSIFLDDYLSALTVGLSMKKITDAHRVPREKLAYIVNTTAAPFCVIVPISTWTIFVGKILESSKVAPEGKGLVTYWHMIPFVVYGFVSVLLIPFFIYGLIPWFGKMKQAKIRTETTGQVSGSAFSSTATLDITPMDATKEPKVIYFILPIVVLLAATIYFDIDALKGVLVSVGFTFFYYLFMKLGNFRQLTETIFSGFNSMIFALAILLMSYMLKDVNDQMHLTQYVLKSASPYLNKQLLPFIIFLSMSVISVTTSASWGLYAVAIPLIVPLAQHFDSNVLLNIGAVVSAGAAGSNACLYSDCNVLTSQSTECNNLDHGLSQLPYAGIAFVISCIVYIILGYTIA